jgi:uncharacterized protein with GYD domain
MPEAEYRNEGQTFERANERTFKQTNKRTQTFERTFEQTNKRTQTFERTIGDHDLKIAKRGKQK